MYIDTHCHLTDDRFDSDLSEVVNTAKQNGVEAVIMPTTYPEDIRKAQQIAEKYDSIYFLAGIHPEEVEKIDIETALSVVKEVLNHPKCLGIGEIGLDFYYDTEKKTLPIQLEVFTRQLEIAQEKSKPVVIHSRKAVDETINILDKLKTPLRGQFHCWGESEEFLKYVLKNNFYVSFCGNLTFKNAQNLRDLCLQVPLDKLLLETDSPYLAPEGLRGTRNNPTNVVAIANEIGKLKKITPLEIGRITTQNARALFSI